MGARIVRKRGRPDLAFHHEQLARVIERLEQREAEAMTEAFMKSEIERMAREFYHRLRQIC